MTSNSRLTGVNGANWQIEQGCPQCGAPLTLDETDRLLACPFCRVKLFIAPERHFRYLIPPAKEMEGDLIYVPYWRLRGSFFTVSAPGVKSRFVDTSVLAADIPGLPPSLGFRPQVLKLRFVSPSEKGRFIPAAETSAEVARRGVDAETMAANGLGLQRLRRRFDSAKRSTGMGISSADELRSGFFRRGFIGETVSLIHAPLFLQGEILYDGVLGRTVSACGAGERERLLASSLAPSDQVRFIPTLCPHCGWDMEGERDSLVLLCRNCSSAWSCNGRTLTRVAHAIIAMPTPAGETAIYLPFWRMNPRFEGLALASWADLIRVANLPKAVRPAFEADPLYFWSPAFRVNPVLYARWARQMTVFRPAGDEGERLPRIPLHPVTLSLEDAAGGIVINLAQMIADKRRYYPLLADLRATLDGARLEYHPFVLHRNELLHAAMGVSMDRTALSYGLGL